MKMLVGIGKRFFLQIASIGLFSILTVTLAKNAGYNMIKSQSKASPNKSNRFMHMQAYPIMVKHSLYL